MMAQHLSNNLWKQHLSNIWSSIYEKVRQPLRLELKKSVVYIKKACVFTGNPWLRTVIMIYQATDQPKLIVI